MSSQRKLRTLACILAVICVLLLRGAPEADAADIRIWIEPLQAKADFSAEFTVEVMIENATDLGYFQFTLEYDPKVVLAKGAVLGDFLGSTGRSTSGLGPRLDNSKGTLTFGGFSFGTVKGPDGKGVLAEVTFTGLARGLSPMRLKDILLSDTDNQSLVEFTVGEGVASIGGAAIVTPEPTATPVMATMTPLSLPTSALTFTPRPRPPATVVPEPSGASTAQVASPSEPLPMATIRPVSTTPGAAVTIVPTGQALTATPAAAGVAIMTPTAQGTTSAPVSTAGGAPTVAATAAATTAATSASALAAGSEEQLTRAATSAPILPGSQPGSASQGAETPDDDDASGAPAWLVATGIGVISLAVAGLVLLAILWARRRRGA